MTTEPIELMQRCAMCGGRFPGPGINASDKVYCCDKCADFHQHKAHRVAAMAPKLLGILSLGAILGYFIGRHRD